MNRSDEDLKQKLLKERVDEQLRSPLRIAYYSFLVAVLLGVCVYELAVKVCILYIKRVKV